ncbi:MAG TPA: FAD:protein FMN transferase [Candidatus Eisenbacteria bacterium]|nr:FAD:protein FMN transferase [Candidatus Eisenbacteria bacterium]
MLKKAVWAALALCLMGADYIGPVQIERTRHLLDAEFHVTVFQAESQVSTLPAILDRAFALVTEIETRDSETTEGSLLWKINRAKAGESFKLDEDLFQTLRTALKVARLTEGVYDPTDGELKKIWVDARGTGQPPPKETVESALRRVGYPYILLDEASRTLTVKQEGVRLDLAALLQGYAVEKVSRFLWQNGVRSGYVRAGGTLEYIGWAGEGKGWRTGLDHPRQIEDYAAVLELPGGRVVAASGDYENFFLYDDKRYTDLIDAKTGYPGRRSVAGVSVIASDATLARAVSEAFFVLGAEEGYKLVDRLKEDGVEAVCIEETGTTNKRLTLSASEGAQSFIKEVRL